MTQLTTNLREADATALLRETAWLRRLAARLVRDPATADDLAQEAVIRALERGGEVHRGWLASVLRSLLSERFRSEGRRRRRERTVASSEGVNDHPLERAALQRDIVDHVLRLPEPERSAIAMRYLDELDYATVARRQSISEGAARQRVSRGVARLRQRLDEESGGRAAWVAIALPWTSPPKHAVLSTAAIPAPAPALALAPSKGLLVAAVVMTAVGGGLLWSLLHGTATGVEDAQPAPVAASLPPVEAVDLADVPAAAGRDSAALPGPGPGTATAQEALSAFPSRSDLATGGIALTVEWADGTPAAGVSAQVLPWSDPTPRLRAQFVRTDQDGRVVVEGLAEGRTGFYVDRSGGGTFDVTAGETREARIRLDLGFDVSGRVTGPDGEPIENASIAISSSGGNGEPVDVAKTGPDGFYLIRQIGQGGSISARAAGFAPADVVSTRDHRADSTYTHDFSLRGGGAELRGVVQDEAGEPIAGAKIRLVIDGRSSPRGYLIGALHPIDHRVSAEDGSFAFPECGAHQVALMVRTAMHAPYVQELHLEAGEVREVEVGLVAGASLSGTILQGDGAPAEGVTIEVGERYSRFQFDGLSARTDKNGGYELRGVPAGPVQVRAFAEKLGSTSGALFAAADEAATWNASLLSGRTVRGRLVDGSGAGMDGCWVMTLSPQGGWSRSVRTDDDGSFTLMNVAAATGFVHTTASKSRSSGLKKKARIVDDTALIQIDDENLPTAGLRVRVQEEGQAPRARARVTLQFENGYTRFTDTDDQGQAEFHGAVPGPAILAVDVEGFPTIYRETTLMRNSVVDAGTIEAERGGRISVSVETYGGYGSASQATVWSEQGELRTFFPLEAGVGTSEPIAAGRYHVTVNGQGRNQLATLVDVRPDETTDYRVQGGPAAYARLNLHWGEGEQAASKLIYQVVSSDRSPWRTVSIFGGESATQLVVPQLPPGRSTIRARTLDGRRGEVEVEITDTSPGAPAVEGQLRLSSQ